MASHSGLTGTIDDDGSGVTGASPGFVNETAQDYHLAQSSTCIDAGTALHPAVLPAHDLLFQYVVH